MRGGGDSSHRGAGGRNDCDTGEAASAFGIT